MRIRTIRLLLSGLALLAPTALYARQPADTTATLRLETLLEQVSSNNPLLRAARLEADALRTRPEQVSALPDPEVMAAYRPLAFDRPGDLPPNQLRVDQSVPFPGKRELAGLAAAYAADAAGHEAEALEQEMRLELKRAYYELYAIQEQSRLIADFQRQLRDFEEAAAVRYEVGQGAQQAVLKAQVERNTLDRRLLALSRERRAAAETIARLTGRPELAAQLGRARLEPAAPRVDSTAAVETALRNRPEVAALGAEIDRAGTEIAMARKEFLPDFRLGVGYMDMMPTGMETPAASVSELPRRFAIEVGVMIPLQLGRRRAALREAGLRREQAEARLEAVETEIRTGLGDVLNRVREEERALALYRGTLIPQARTTLEATVAAYQTGRTDFLDLLDAERMLYELHMDEAMTRAGFLTALAELERALGLLSPAAQPASAAR